VQTIESEGHDKSTLSLPGHQADLIAALRSASGSRPFVGVLIHGSAITLGPSVPFFDALIDAWYLT
jgi:hypothetical protein